MRIFRKPRVLYISKPPPTRYEKYLFMEHKTNLLGTVKELKKKNTYRIAPNRKDEKNLEIALALGKTLTIKAGGFYAQGIITELDMPFVNAKDIDVTIYPIRFYDFKPFDILTIKIEEPE